MLRAAEQHWQLAERKVKMQLAVVDRFHSLHEAAGNAYIQPSRLTKASQAVVSVVLERPSLCDTRTPPNENNVDRSCEWVQWHSCFACWQADPRSRRGRLCKGGTGHASWLRRRAG